MLQNVWQLWLEQEVGERRRLLREYGVCFLKKKRLVVLLKLTDTCALCFKRLSIVYERERQYIGVLGFWNCDHVIYERLVFELVLRVCFRCNQI